MQRILFVIALLFFSLSHSLQGQNWKHYHQNEISPTYGYFFQSVENTNRTIPELSAKYEWEARYKTKLKTFVSLNSILNVHESKRRRIWFNQAFLAFNKKKFFGKVGKQIIKWGRLTGWSALDMANVYDYYDFLRTENEALGVWAMDGKMSLKKWQIQFKVLPFQKSSRLYFENNRWIRLPQSFQGPNDIVFSAELNEVKKVKPSSSVSYGLSIGYENDDFEINFNGFSGSNDIPQRQSQPLAPNLSTKVLPYNIELVYHRMNIATIAMNKLIGDYSLWSEVSIVNNQRMNDLGNLEPDNYWGITVGVDRLFIFENPEKQLKLLAQYLKNFTNSEIDYSVNDLDHVLDHSFLLDATYQFNYTWKASMRSVLNLTNLSHAVSTSLNYKLNDKFSFICSADFLYGNDQHFFGYYQDNSRVLITMKYHL